LAPRLPLTFAMTARPDRNNAHLKLAASDRDVPATAIREQKVTHTLAPRVHGSTANWRQIVVALAIAAVAACGGGGKKTDTYARANDVQGTCCEHLKGDGRDQCLKGIVRIDDGAIAHHDVNQATYACVVDHFTCDPSTGHPTQQSAQAQLECIQDLQ
jgi:hypothetical protein